MQRSPSTSSTSTGGIPNRRTRAHVGTTNRKYLQAADPTSPDTRPPHSPKPHSPSHSPSSSHSHSHPHTAQQSTASSMGKQRDKREKNTREGKERKDAEQAHLDMMRCKFVECFEDGKNNLRTGTTYLNPENNMPPTRFSCAPPPHDTSYLTTAEYGSPSYISEPQRLSTTYNSSIHTYTAPDAPPPRRGHQPEIVDENAVLKAKAKEREAGRLARIRENNARVDAYNTDFNAKISADDNRRIATVKKQQEGYAQAIAVRQARGFE